METIDNAGVAIQYLIAGIPVIMMIFFCIRQMIEDTINAIWSDLSSKRPTGKDKKHG